MIYTFFQLNFDETQYFFRPNSAKKIRKRTGAVVFITFDFVEDTLDKTKKTYFILLCARLFVSLSPEIITD